MRGTIFLLAVSGVISGISFRMIEAMLPALAVDFGVSISAAASVITAFAFAYGGSQLVHGPLGDRLGTLRYLTWLLACAGVVSIGCGFAPGVASLAALRFGVGLFASASVTLGMAYIGDNVPRNELQPTVARFISGTIIGHALGPVVGGGITDLLGWRGTFFVIGASFLAVALLLGTTTRSQWRSLAKTWRANPVGSYLEVLALVRVRWVLAVTIVETFLFFGPFAFLGAFLQVRFGLSLTLIGIVLAGFGVGGIVYTTSVKWLLGALRQRGLVLTGGIAVCGCYLAFAGAPAWPIAILLTSGLGLSFFMIHNTLQVKATEMAPDARATGLCLYSGVWAIGQALGVAAMGALVTQFDYVAPIVAFAILFALLGFWLSANLRRLSQ